MMMWRGPDPAFICTTGGVFAVSRPVFASKAELEDLVGAQVRHEHERLVLSVMMAWALRPVGSPAEDRTPCRPSRSR